MKRISLPSIVGASLALTAASDAAWFINGPNETLGSSGSFTVTPAGTATYDRNGTDVGEAFDIAAIPFTVSYTIIGAAADLVSVIEEVPGTGANASAFEDLEFDLDADGNGVLPTSIMFTITYSQPIGFRGLGFGAVGVGVNSELGLRLDIEDFQATDGTGGLVDLSNLNRSGLGINAGTNGTIASGNDLTRNSGISNGNTQGGTVVTNTEAALPFGSTDPSQQLVSQSFTVTDFTPEANGAIPASNVFRFTFDGGVAIPEPSSSLLVFLGALGLIRRRR